MSSKLERKKIVIPTYAVGKAEPLPIFFEKRPYQGASGKLYPISYVPNITDEKKDKEYDAIILENDYIRTEILPEVGGKINTAFDKTSGYDFIYNNKVIKPAMVGLAGPWVSGGIEFNWPQHHRPTTFMPLDCSVKEDENVKTVYVGEVDYYQFMKGMAAISIDDKHSYIKANITIFNSTPEKHPFMWWANMAVEVNDDYKIVFPPDVEYVNDHDRRAVLNWPIAKGIYKTARPFDYGDGTDIHKNSAVKVPSSFMVSKGQSDMDFVCGYDSAKNCGVVSVADHHIAPGKKLWTWGNEKFGAKWCANLTDDNSRYVELMTGCYTDNQPDFSWIAPYETKIFEQYWYPVKDIGEVKNANIEGACNLENTKDGVFVGFYSTSERKNCRLELKKYGKTIFSQIAEVSPEKVFTTTISGLKVEELALSVYDGETLILSYTKPKSGNKKPIEPRKPAPKPDMIQTTEELYLQGIHLIQYKHFAYRAENYFMEALRRDKYDVRNNEAMGNFCLERGRFDDAKIYYTNALQRLTIRNFNPYDTEPYYKRALCRFYEGDLAGAYEDAYASVWSYPMRSAGYYLLAKLSSLKGDKTAAIEFLKESLKTNSENLWAKYILSILREDKTAEEEIRKIDPLFVFEEYTEKTGINTAIEFMQFGLLKRAEEVLLKTAEGAMKYYYLAFLANKVGKAEDSKKYIAKADSMPWQCEFPSRKESIEVLKFAQTARADYYLGCVFYNFERYNDACEEWEKTVEKEEFAPAYRNLSLGYYDHLSRPADARICLEKAHKLAPESDRIFFELTKLYKSLNLSLEERLNLYRNNLSLVEKRDDCILDCSILFTISGNYQKAKQLLLHHRFHTYEGGEGNLTQHHAWLQFLVAKEEQKNSHYNEVRKAAEEGLEFPENYGEEKNYFVNDAPLYLCLADCAKKENNRQEEEKYLFLACSTKGVPTVHSYFQCIAYKRLGKNLQAENLAKEMIEIGENKLKNSDINDYYGVGAPAYPPFGYDIIKTHSQNGKILCAFGELALGNKEIAKKYAQEIEKMDNSDFFLYILKKELYD